MGQFSERMVTEIVQLFWAAMQRGEFITDAAVAAGTYRKKGSSVGDRATAGCVRAVGVT